MLQSKYGVGKLPAKQRGLITANNEMLNGLQVGNYSDEVPVQWRKASGRLLALQESRHATVEYANGITTVIEEDEIRALKAGKIYKGKTNRGIKIGDKRDSVLASYGFPALSLATTQGNSLVYLDQGITFQIIDEKVVSWIIY